jgi:hypothetical protein
MPCSVVEICGHLGSMYCLHFHHQISQAIYQQEAEQWLGLALSKGPNRIGFFPHLRTETDPVSETSCFFLFFNTRTMDRVRKLTIAESVYFAYLSTLKMETIRS